MSERHIPYPSSYTNVSYTNGWPDYRCTWCQSVTYHTRTVICTNSFPLYLYQETKGNYVIEKNKRTPLISIYSLHRQSGLIIDHSWRHTDVTIRDESPIRRLSDQKCPVDTVYYSTSGLLYHLVLYETHLYTVIYYSSRIAGVIYYSSRGITITPSRGITISKRLPQLYPISTTDLQFYYCWINK